MADATADMSQAGLDGNESQIGHYKTVEDLGVGGYSRVKLAQDQKTGNYVAVKILLSEPTKVVDPNTKTESIKWIISDSKKKQCRREIKLMQQIQHKNVVALVDYIEDATFPQEHENKIIKSPCLCVVLEYCSRGELFDFLMYTGRLGERATRTYFHQFLNGLNAMHKSGYAHRDLKPENLLLSDDFTLKIADFGFATQFKDNRKKIKMATTCGTKGYLAPELLAGHKYTHKVDLFAVGIIMFTTFAGFPPFQHAGSGDWWWDKMSKAWTYWTEAPLAKNAIEKNERFKKGNEKMRLFWAAHERSLPFEDSFKDLMQNLLNPYPKQRYDIDDCLKHPWMKGKTFGRRQIVKYMKQYSSTVRAQRAIKIQKQLEEMSPAQKRPRAKRAQLDQQNMEQFDKIVSAFEKQVEQMEENEALVNKVRFKFESKESLLDILLTIDTIVNKNSAFIDIDENNAECKIIGGVSRKGKKNAVLEAEDVKIMVKIYRPKMATFDDADTGVEFDIDGKFLDDDDDNDSDADEEEEDAKDDQGKNDSKKSSGKVDKTRWAVLFYRVEGSADGFQQMMAKIFYSQDMFTIMDLTDDLKLGTKAQLKKLGELPERTAAFATTFEPVKVQKNKHGLPDGIGVH